MRECKAPLIFLILTLALAACSGHQGASSLLPTANGTTHVHRNTATGTLSVSGPIAALISGGFTINGGAGIGYLHVYTNGSTTFSGPAPAVGEQAQVTGTGSFATSLTAITVTTSAASAPIPPQNNKISVAGPITATFTGGFTINAGPNVGYMHVYTNASTTFNNGSMVPKAGLYAQATGTGTLATSVTATYLTLWNNAPSTVTITGTATGPTSYGFTTNAGTSNPTVPIVMNASTIVGGGQLATGTQVKITGIGAANASVTAASIVVSAPVPTGSPSPTPGPITTKHVLTADYLGAPYGTTSVAWSQAAQYLSWAQVNVVNANAIAATGIKTQLYVDPNRTSAGVGDPLYNNDETTFAHDCSNNRVTDTYNGTTTQYVMDVTSPSMQATFSQYVTSILAQGHYDAIFEDDAGPLSAFSQYTPFSAMPCDYADAAWMTAENVLDQAPPLPVLFNGLSSLNGHDVSASTALLSSNNTIGGNFEHCYSDNSQPKMDGWLWQAIENTQLQLLAQHKTFECQLRNTADAASQTDARLYALASFLLTYDPASSIFWEEYGTASGLHVLPESQLVPLNPVVPSPANVSSLLQNGGTYGRQYNRCYIAGNYVGACAIVVNPDSQLGHANPFPQYAHTLVLNGGGILDGGTIATNGPPPPSTLAPQAAAIVFP